MPDTADPRSAVLVAIMNKPLDFALAHDRHWYRIPVESADKRLKTRFPPTRLAFYQTRVFGEDAFAVNYSARVEGVRIVPRWELFPEEPPNEKTERRYYQLLLAPLERLSRPIVSRRWRRIIFIPTTFEKFETAAEINDLYDESPLEDELWAAMKQQQLSAERQEYVRIGAKNYALDFALYCAKGNIDVETDGDSWHDPPERVKQDKKRDNDLNASGWHTLHFTTSQIKEQVEEYCIAKMKEAIDNLGGLDEPGRFMPRKVGNTYLYQPTLFEAKSEYAANEVELDDDELWRIGEEDM